MAIPRGTCPRDWGRSPGDTRFTLVVVACFGAEENQIANITRIFPVPLKTSFQRRADRSIQHLHKCRRRGM
jgi:hypothetical protein